jgi:hypothetical protein
MSLLKEEQPLKSKLCCACKKEKDIKSFYVNKYMPTGYDPRCKMCKQSKIRCRVANGEGKKSSVVKKRNSPQLWNVGKQDWLDTYNFLEKIGYDLHTNIHEQFCSKHNLKPRERMWEKSIQYSPEELGMI